MKKEESRDNTSEVENTIHLIPDPDCIYCEGKGVCFCGPCPCLHLPEESENT